MQSICQSQNFENTKNVRKIATCWPNIFRQQKRKIRPKYSMYSMYIMYSIYLEPITYGTSYNRAILKVFYDISSTQVDT